MKMNILQRVQKIRGAETDLGITFCTAPEYIRYLPDGSRMFAKAGTKLFCFIYGYQETVFVIDTVSGKMKPLAYDVSEFLRLIFTCGSAERAACMAFSGHNKAAEMMNSRRTGLKKIQNTLGLSVIANPAAYVKTVGQVLDCSRLKA